MSPHKENRQAKLVGVLSIAGMLAMVWIVAVFFKSTQQKLGVADTDSSPSPVPMSGDPARMDAADSDISIVRKNPAEKSSDTAEPLVLIADQPNSDP
ncbi:hypothetical protein GW813_12930, partial [bacterium]|nr:hypothetical protein [bacterium]